ncbi:MAG: DUF1295 domain-containing protein [Pseudomonadota bacterium]
MVTLVIFAVLWPVSVHRHDASLVDFWWGPGFLAQTLVAAYLAEAMGSRSWLIVVLVALWALRLGFVLIRRRLHEGSEDPRYTALRRAWEPGFWWKSFFVVFMLQGFLQWLIAIGPIMGVLSGPEPLSVLAWLGALVALGGLALEARADHELDFFKRENPHGLCDTGLRAHIRHPNYVGEIVFWSGVGLVVVEVSPWAALVSPALITLFLTQVSGAPMLDERLSESRPSYADYKARVPAFLPRLRQ